MPAIVAIEQIKGNRKKFEIKLFGDEHAYYLTEETIIKNHLKLGVEVSDEQMVQLITESDTTEGFARALKMLERTMKTEQEMVQFLHSKKFCAKAIENILEKLKEYAFVKDENYAELYVSYASKHKGKRMVAYELQRKGVHRTVIDNALASITSELETATLVANKYIKNKEHSKENAAKLFRHLLSKGFDMDTVKQVVSAVLSGVEEENESWN